MANCAVETKSRDKDEYAEKNGLAVSVAKLLTFHPQPKRKSKAVDAKGEKLLKSIRNERSIEQITELWRRCICSTFQQLFRGVINEFLLFIDKIMKPALGAYY